MVTKCAVTDTPSKAPEGDFLVDTKELKKFFVVRNGHLHAVDGVNLHIRSGETYGLVGESGCGKTTVGRVLARLIEATGGQAYFRGQDILSAGGASLKLLRQKIQMIFQDPYSSLNPRKSVHQTLADTLHTQGLRDRAEIKMRIDEACSDVGISRDMLEKYPHELDGGKRQIVGIARALCVQPEFIICDEPVSALDVSMQGQVINLLMDLQAKRGIAYLFISHDLSVVRHLSSVIGVMYLGQIVEQASCDDLFSRPVHPYTQALLSAVPTISPDRQQRIVLSGDVPSPINPGPGCRFHNRCFNAKKVCEEKAPPIVEVSPGHFVSCWV